MRRKLLFATTVLLASLCVFQGPADHENSANAAQIATISVASQPDALVQDGPYIWVASCSGNAVDEIDPNSRQVIQSIAGATHGFRCPDALAVDGPNIWVANKNGNSVIEFNASTGALTTTLSGPDIVNPDALAITGPDLWVSDVTFISEFSTSSGLVVRTITTPKDYKFAFSEVTSLVVSGSDIWESDFGGDGADEFSIGSGAYVGHTDSAIGVGVSGIAYRSGRIWLSGTPNANGVVAEYSSKTGAYIRSINTPPGPGLLFFTGADLFVEMRSLVDSVTEYSATGTLLKTVMRSNRSHAEKVSALLVIGHRLWTANYSTNSVSESTF